MLSGSNLPSCEVDKAAVENPQNYMKAGRRRIVIRENCQGGISEREILNVTRQTNSALKINEEESREVQNAYSEINTNSVQDDGSTSPGSSARAQTIADSEGSSQSESSTIYVTFDPQPRSHTILTKAATISSRRQRSKSPPVISLTMKSKSTVTSSDSKPEKSTATLEKMRAYQERANDVPRVFRVIPDDCAKKYERFTYLPGVKVIPSHTQSWKVPILQKKNKDAIDEFLKRLYPNLNDMQQRKESERKLDEAERIEKQRQDAIPEWKKPMVKTREQKKKLEHQMLFERAQVEKEETERYSAMPPWRQELVMRKKEQERLNKLPTWQKDLLAKKKVAQNKAAFEASKSSESNSVPWSRPNLRKTPHKL